MRRHQMLVVVAAVLLTPVLASEPGQPLDCSDWVFTEPGYRCVDGVEFPQAQENPIGDELDFFNFNNQGVFDNQGRLFRVRNVYTVDCGGTTFWLYRHELTWWDGGQWRVLGSVEDRCVDGAAGRADFVEAIGGLVFDAKNGAMAVYTHAFGCTQNGCVAWVDKRRLIRIEGFSTDFEILQTYTPTSGPISFRVPYMPEGFPASDYFDTYYGDLATVGDWSQAQPLQCGYPASPPSVGDYLEVDDPLPSPDPNRGRYYVTAIHYQGQTRYGRKASGGVLSGRDPAVLPACAP